MFNQVKQLTQKSGIRIAACLALACGLAGPAFFWSASAAETSAAASLPAAPPLKVEEKDAPGVAVTFFAAGTEAKPGAGDTRVSRMIALYVPAGQPASPFVAPGAFTATFDGAIVMRLRDTFTFTAEGRGDVTVSVNDTEALKATGDDFSKAPAGKPVRLNKGKNKLLVTYKSPPTGDATFRLLWTAKDENYADPIPPTALSHNAGAEPVAKGMRQREGRQLFAELRCVKCHTTAAAEVAVAGIKPIPADPVAASKYAPMPELAMDAPALADIGTRLNANWMTVWINNPHALRPNPHMPRVFKPAGDDKDAIDPRSADIAAYLGSLGVAAADKPGPKISDETVSRGGQLFTHLNCVACHEPPAVAENAAPAEPPPDGEEPPPARIPLKYVKEKFKPDALPAFLQNPSAHYTWIPMPNFRLSADEANALAAFLLSEANGTLPEKVPAGDAAKGVQLVQSSGCLNCHALTNEKSTLKSASLAEIGKDAWTRGCLSADDAGRKTAPVYELTDAQREAIVAFAATDRSSLLRESPAEFAMRQVKSLNCNGCHARDGKEPLLSTVYESQMKELGDKYPAPKGDTAEAFAPDQRAPLMTWFGEKLRPQWSSAFLSGQIAYKPRPYLHARMPAFASRAGLLSAGLAAEHGVAPIEPANPKPDQEQNAIGNKLAGKTPNQSFGCTQCHAVQKMPPFAPFEAPAINFMHTTERIRKDYYHRWIHAPLKVDPNTKMPAFERDDGKTTILTVYEGDARKQFEAVWQYLLDGKEIKPPTE